MEKYLIDIRSLLAKYIIDLPVNYPIIIWKNPPINDRIDIGGLTNLEGYDWIKINKNVQIATQNIIYEVYVLECQDLNKTVYHFLHELAHTITPAERSKVVKSSLLQPYAKTKKKYTPLHHPQSFYKNLSKILRIAKKLKIWIPPIGFKGFALKSITRFDSFTV